MSRDWTPLEEDPRWEEEGYWDKVKPELDLLAQNWSRIHKIAEERFFLRQYEEEEYRDQDEEEEAWDRAQRDLQNKLEQAQIDVIEERLQKLGARMMRPYEHWNEEERYMEYMENRGY